MKKRITLVLAVIFITMLAVVSCKGKGSSSSTVPGTADSPGWKLNADKPIQFDWYIHFNWFSRSWGDSRVSKYITAKTGVDIRFVVPAGNEAERLNTMIAGNVLPDLITLGWWEGQIPQMVEAGMLEPLNKLAEQYDPYFFKVAVAQKLGWYTRDYGNVYGYPNASFTSNDFQRYKGSMTANETFLVRKDMYEAIGSPNMSTPEGFLAALRAARDRFPSIGGQPIIPLAFQNFTDTGNNALQAYLQHFLAILPEANGKYEDPELGRNDPEYVRWLKVFRQAASEGLITMDVFTDGRPQIEEKAAQGRYFSLLYQNWDMQAPQAARYDTDPNTIYIAIEGPKNSRNANHILPGGGISGWTLTLISKNCKDPARAIQFMTYLISEEGQMDVFFGVPDGNPYGIAPTYRIENGVPQHLPEVRELNNSDKNRQEIEIGVDYTYWMLMDNAWQNQFATDFAPSVAQPQIWTRPYVASFAHYDQLDMPVGSDEAMIRDNIARRWGQDLPRLLMARTEAEFDRIWNDFQTFKRDQGFEKLQNRQTELLNANKRKLGIN
jgi:putative aldouronate transport system substrate-binding protein